MHENEPMMPIMFRTTEADTISKTTQKHPENLERTKEEHSALFE